MGNPRAALLALAVALSAAPVAGCGAAPATIPAGTPQRADAFVTHYAIGSGKRIDHVVIIIQENRSFDNLFQGYPHADTQSYGLDSKNQKIPLEPLTLKTTWDLGHSFASFIASCNGTGTYPGTHCRMNGFDKEYADCGHQSEPKCPIKHPQYAYVPHSEIQPYFDMAGQYVLADHMFVSNIDISSFVSHQYIIAGQASMTVDVPEGGSWGCDGQAIINTLTKQRTVGPAISACLDNETLGDELDAAKISWRYYTASLGGNGDFWSAYQAIKHIYEGPDWKKDVISPQTRFFGDVKNGRLPAVSWITPTCQNSDHAGCNGKTGPMWVASLVNAIGESAYWKSTAIFVFWDDPGGWYDHVAPKKLDYDGLGFRVPLLVISPYAKKGYISSVPYEHGSLLRFIENRFGLARLAATDARATSPEGDCFDFSQSPRKFTAIPTAMNARDFELQPLDRRPVDTE